jgi:ABC-type nitrate/sulfonate/bicarbonate transport system permease component
MGMGPVAEFLGRPKGLGFLIGSSVNRFDTAQAFAGLLAILVLGGKVEQVLHG